MIESRKQTNDMRIYTLSTLTNNHKLFAKLAYSAYFAMDFISQDYPNLFEWYWSKAIPRVFNGTGEVVICIANGNIAGITLLKKDATENKICTFFVVENIFQLNY